MAPGEGESSREDRVTESAITPARCALLCDLGMVCVAPAERSVCAVVDDRGFVSAIVKARQQVRAR